MMLERNSNALLANIHRDQKKQPLFRGRDFYRLSYEEIVEETKKMTNEEVMAKVKRRFKKYFKDG